MIGNNDDAKDSEAEYDEALDDVLTTLRREYEDELPTRFAELKEYVQKAKDGGEKQLEWLAQAHTIAHRLAGTAGSYGLAELSNAAGVFDAYCKHLLKNKAHSEESRDAAPSVTPLDWQEIEAMTNAIFESHPEKRYSPPS
jgi:HPt (histidine-containing phosphotransfer) domain-containing protein